MERYVVEDLGTLKALAHPVRTRALGELRRNGPATASDLARVLGESSGSLSYHLRQLERYGFVTDDVARDGRERRWRAAHDATTLPSELAATPEGRSALGVIKGVQRRHLEDLLAAIDADPGGVVEHSDYLLRLDRPDFEELIEELDAVITRYAGRGGEHHLGLHLVAAPTETD
ncbi:ArsR/SmtB family transcription factor [Aeromicrobium sp. CF4.19]|uniref:ArsR/SmtB family transcription factor n=1 Tax=Aeromicrobium sp. CF4.19 TaxID=3373082 RepID=UPI003EE595A9